MTSELTISAKWWIKRNVLRPWLTCARPAAGNRVALTFDDGPHPLFTRQALDALDAHDAKATFFCIGSKLVEHQELASEIARRGHELSNHSMTHPALSGLAYRSIVSEFDSVFSLTGSDRSHLVTPRLIRPPFGTINLGVLRYCVFHGAHIVYWNRDPKDFDAADADQVLAMFRDQPPIAGDIVLLHDSVSHCGAIVEGVLNIIADSGLEAVTVSTLLDSGGSPTRR